MNPGPSRYQVYMLPNELSWLEYFTFKLNFLTLFFSEMFSHGPSRSFWLPKTVGPFILQRFQKNCKSQICDANTTKGILRFTIEVNAVYWILIYKIWCILFYSNMECLSESFELKKRARETKRTTNFEWKVRNFLKSTLRVPVAQSGW